MAALVMGLYETYCSECRDSVLRLDSCQNCGVEFTAISKNPSDGNYLDSDMQQLQQVAEKYGIPIVGTPDMAPRSKGQGRPVVRVHIIWDDGDYDIHEEWDEEDARIVGYKPEVYEIPTILFERYKMTKQTLGTAVRNVLAESVHVEGIRWINNEGSA